jgi:general secretion pathway protein K
MKKTISMLKDDSGAALMIAIFAITMLMIIATEIMYETSVEYVVSTQTINQVKAHYAAKAGVQISLLRLFIYKKVMSVGGDMAKQLSMLDMIWKLPFAWPPMTPDGTSRADKEAIKDVVKNSKMGAQYLATIESEGSKIDLTTLASDKEQLFKPTMEQLEQIFTDRMENDQEFARKHSGEDFHKIIANIKDWVDPDEKDERGTDESALYTNLGDGGKGWPPNQPFKTFDELHMVAGMTDEYFKMIAPRVTIFGAKAINIKYASRDVIKSLFKLTEEQAGKVMEERDKEGSTSFKDSSTFYQFLQSLGVRTEAFKDKDGKDTLNLLFEPEFNFKIKSVGISGKVQREITAIVYDMDQVAAQLKKFAPTPSPTATGTVNPNVTAPTPTPTAAPPAAAAPVANEAPNIVYWFEQ